VTTKLRSLRGVAVIHMTMLMLRMMKKKKMMMRIDEDDDDEEEEEEEGSGRVDEVCVLAPCLPLLFPFIR
jgi:hypothetical protein